MTEIADASMELDFDCLGNESSLLDCLKIASGSMCGANNTAAGVVCPEPCFSGDIRLVDGSDNLEGRIEICVDGFWSSVCDQSWSSYDAAVACRQLGLSSIGK